MSEDDDYRVEARLAGASRGVSPTTEQIQTLLERQRTHEKLTRATPQKAFDRVMREQGNGDDGGQKDSQPDDQKAPDAEDTSILAQPPPTRDTFVRRSGLPPGFQRSGRAQAPIAADAKAPVQPPPPTGPLSRHSSGPSTNRPGKKIIIRG